MNKLKKLRPPSEGSGANAMSRTMQLAVSEMKVSAPQGDPANLQRRAWFSAPSATHVERYWVVRALVAETLLSARKEHQDELAEMRGIEERKREREIASILHANDQRQRRSERLMMMCLAVLLGLIGWLVMRISPDRGQPGQPLHFAIPILSPFASVVEHETGIIGTRAVVILVLVIGIAAYGALNLKRWHTR